MNTAIIVAAGTGSRFGNGRPKQFLEILGKPVIQYSLELFDRSPSIDAIIVVTALAEIDNFRQMAAGFDLKKLDTVVAGGHTRAHSVLNGLEAVRQDGIVAVHDAARPLVSIDEIERTVSAAAEHGAACLTAEVNDTIKTVAGGEITGTLDRDKLRRALTPQAFRTELLKKAYENIEIDAAITDECYAVEKLGHPIVWVDGSARNIKITVAGDMIIAEALLRN